MGESATALCPPPRPWRVSARLLVIDSTDRLLVIRACDPSRPDLGEWWEVPGGGVDPGEDSIAAAVRETAEETGFVVPRRMVGPACWRGEATYTWAGRRHWASLIMHLARVDGPAAQPALGGPQEEKASLVAVRWILISDVTAGTERCFPASLPIDLPRLLAGELIDAGLTVWD